MRDLLLTLSLTLAVGQPVAADQEPLLRDFVGLNGHLDFRPELYRPVCRLARNYHNIGWDVRRPGDPITLPKCVNRVDWDKQVYGRWKRHGFEVDLCAMFGSLGEGNEKYRELWAGQEEWMFEYGRRLAEHFGPTHGADLVTSIEIGNEPGADFDDALYRRLFVSMARGVRAGDPAVRIVTATAHAREADKYSKSLDETYGSAEMLPLYDVINLHAYALKPHKKGRSPWDRSHPEDAAIDYLKIVDEAIAWRDRRAPDKEVWITEFGYDACTPGAMADRTGWFEKLDWRGVTDLQQAQYLVRSTLCFSAREVDRAYLYYYNDSDKPSVHAASGLTRGFEPKPAYWAMRGLYDTLGDYRFSRAVTESRDHYVYEYTHADDRRKVVWAVWSPTGDDRQSELTLRRLPGAAVKAIRMPTADGPAPAVRFKRPGGDALTLAVSESPTYVLFKRAD